MLTDHFGLMFFPFVPIYRIIGRLAFPIFAFMIAEGTKYTRNRSRYFFNIFILGAVCQAVYFFLSPDWLYMNILLTFSVSILLIYILDLVKAEMFSKSMKPMRLICFTFLFISALIAVYLINTLPKEFLFDYGFAGFTLPLLVSLFDFKRTEAPDSLKKLDCIPVKVVALGIGLILFCLDVGSIQWYSLVAIIPLLMYSGKRGKYNLKYFFYIFYPLHLVLLAGILLLTKVF